MVETRLNPDKSGYQLVITDTDSDHVQTEDFDTVSEMLRREHELIQAWRAQGWRYTDPARKTDWRGPA
jgi:hypothetical protein